MNSEVYILLNKSEVTDEMSNNSIIHQYSIDKEYMVLSCNSENKPDCFNGMNFLTEEELRNTMFGKDGEGIWYGKPPE